MSPFRVAVLASGTGTNLQAILDQVHGRDGIEVACVASNKPSALALRRAADAGIETGVFEREEFGWSFSPATWSCSRRRSWRGFATA